MAGLDVLALGLALLAGPPQATTAAEGLPAIVHLGDGTSVPLRRWTLSYEYLAWPRGSAQELATPARRDTRLLWVGRRPVDTAGLTVELEYERPKPQAAADDAGGGVRPVVRRLRLHGADGRTSDLKPEPPHRDLLLPAGKDLLLVARSLDLRGETVTGTRRELCVLSYTSLVECGVEPGGRVVRIEFPE